MRWRLPLPAVYSIAIEFCAKKPAKKFHGLLRSREAAKVFLLLLLQEQALLSRVLRNAAV
jgi:hypothetical protein